jgi:N-acetylmuramoyl-L-alanine amidase
MLNGVPVEGRSSKGYFGVLVPLNAGANSFTFTQGASSLTRVITLSTGGSGSGATAMKSAEIPADSTFPQAQEYRAPGDRITLSCKAPIGSKVTVAIGGSRYAMTPATTNSPGKGLYATTYTYSYVLPTYTGKARVVDLGAPVYTMTLGKTTKARKAPVKVGVIMPGAPFHAIATQTVVNTYDKPSSSDGASSEFYNGMVDTVATMSGSYIKLSSGKWVSRSAMRTYTTTEPLNPVVKAAAHLSNSKWETLQFDLSSPVVSTAVQNGNVIRLSIALAKSGPTPVIASNSIVSAIQQSPTASGLEYTITLKDPKAIDGFAVIKTPTGILLNLKKPVRIAGGSLPLSGITIMLDPGHGGNDTGATGPLGAVYPEKTINLNNALALQAELIGKGATVLMTRSTDIELTLDQRLTQSRDARPDLFISIHANSMENNVDISKISGFSAYYREDFALGITQHIHDSVVQNLAMPSKGVHDRNFYVTRGTWTPSILLEAGFVPNPADFEKLSSPEGQAQMAQAVTQGIIGYFTR